VGHAPTPENVQRETAVDGALHTVHRRRLQAFAGVLDVKGDGGIQGDTEAALFIDLVAENEALGNPHVQEFGAGRQRLGLLFQAQAGGFPQDFG
jgi:hypothetical protein